MPVPEQKMKSDHFYSGKLLKDMVTEISENSPVSTAANLVYNFAHRASTSESRQQGRVLNFSHHAHDNTITPLSVIFC